MLLANGETVLRGHIDRLTGIGTCCGMEINVDKTVMRFPRQASLLQIMTDQRRLEIVEYFNRLGCLMQYYTRN